LLELRGLANDVVVDVGDVLAVVDLETLITKVLPERVVEDVVEGVAEMRDVVGRDPADVDAGPSVARRKSLFLARQRVEQQHIPRRLAGRRLCLPFSIKELES